MKKYLLFGTALFLAAGSYAQNSRLTRPSGILDTRVDRKEFAETTGQNSNAFVGPIKKARTLVNPNAKIAAVTATKFTGSMNVLGYLISSEKPLTFTKGINAVSFIARKSSTYTATSNSNSGTIVGHTSTNFGASWEFHAIWTNAS